MKSFFKYMFASMVGFIITLLLLFVILFGMLASIASFTSKEEVKVPSNCLLHVKLAQQIKDRGSDNPMKNFDFASFKPKKDMGLNTILKNIEKAKLDTNIKGIYLDISIIPAGMATIEEIRNALLDFKEAGKFIVSYSEVYSQRAYYLASVSDKIWVNPEGVVDFRGLNAQVTFFKRLLEKLDVEAQVIRHGKFKSAVEPFVMEKMSEANKEQTRKYITSLWNHFLKGVSEQRGISIDTLNAMANEMRIELAKDAVANKIADATLYKDQVIDELKELLNVEEDKDLKVLKLTKYTNAPHPKKKEYSKNKVAVVFAEGEIKGGNDIDDVIGSEKISKTLRKVRKDSTVKAVVFRVNSPGGSALASEVILREVMLIKKEKPIIISMGDLAASGGYWISCLADKIYASPNTLTGSIGVFGIIPNMEGLLNDKIGLTFDNVKTNDYADMGDVSRPLREYERKKIKKSVEHIYDLFLEHVSKGRNMTKEQVDEIGQGRVWSGFDAKQIGLIDEFGGLNDAITDAVNTANLEECRIVEYPRRKSPFEQILEQFKTSVKAQILEGEFEELYNQLKYVKELSEKDTYQARLPMHISVN